MNLLEAARRFAYKYLDGWIEKHKHDYAKSPYAADYNLAMDFLLKECDTKFALPEEYIAASILEEVLCIEGCIESGDADTIYEGETETLYEILIKRLNNKVVFLETLSTKGIVAAISETIPKEKRKLDGESSDKPLHTRTENNYLRLILTLANSIKGFNPKKPYEAAELIINETDIGLSPETVAKYISKAYELDSKERD